MSEKINTNGVPESGKGLETRTRHVLSSRSHVPAGKPAASFLFPIIVILVIAGGIIAYIFSVHGKKAVALEKSTEELLVNTVSVIHPERESADVKILLPGTVQALRQTAIYARVDGYLKRWLVDIGTSVHEGQLLAEIDTPEIDQQLSQAQAVMKQTEADLVLAQTSADRWKKLLKDNAVSQQEADEKAADLEVKKADLAAAEASVRRLEQLQSFQKIYAPFDGVITARMAEVGNLINAGSTTQGRELFQIAQTRTLRVFVNVPEVYSSYTVPGISAQIEMATAPGQEITGKLVRTSRAIDPVNHTLLAEIEIPNEDGKLLPGGYAQVHFSITMDHPPLDIPANTLIFRSKGPQVGVVDQNGTVHLMDIQIGRDFGNKLEVLQGLDEASSVILNPSDSLTEGTKVQVEEKASTPGKP